MGLRNFFIPRWRHPSAKVRQAAIAKITNPKKLRKIAAHSDDEQLRLEAARRLNDGPLMMKIAQSASQEAVRLQAAILVQDQSCLAAIALNEWDIPRGQQAVGHIHNDLLLRRVACSAQQDAIRLAAALKIDDPDLFRKVAASSRNIHVRWQLAQKLDDPFLMAEIALSKPANERLEALRQKARRALLNHLDNLQRHGNHNALLAIMQIVTHPPFKLESFLRLPLDQIQITSLQYLSRQNFRYTPAELLERMFDTIRTSGWDTQRSVEKDLCVHCRGVGNLSIKCISADNTWVDRDLFPCPECNGKGSIIFKVITCTRGKNEHVIFRLVNHDMVDGDI